MKIKKFSKAVVVFLFALATCFMGFLWMASVCPDKGAMLIVVVWGAMISLAWAESIAKQTYFANLEDPEEN